MKATFGAGCFWHVEESFREVKGVTKTTVGFMGGTVKDPTYEEVCSGKTGHIEVCQVEYDPKTISYEELLDIFWSIHDPTQVGGQGVDMGYQYLSVIFYHDEEQKNIAKESLKKKQKKLSDKISTMIEPAKEFFKAEEHHQKYLKKKGLHTC